MITARLPIAVAALGLTAMLLAGCTTTAATRATEPSPSATAATNPVAEPTPESTESMESTASTESPEADSCSRLSEVISHTDGLYLQRQGTLRDRGAREFAQGEVAVDEDGTPVTYTVAPGDVETVVAERLCAYPNLGSMNHRRDIHPGQVLWLTPNPDTPWVDYYGPHDAPAGFPQIPYQQAIESAGRAVDAGEVDSVRRIWNDTLRPMFSNQVTIDAVQKVVDAGDLDALRQLFS
ncbi:hypothetical protein V2S04_05160 [Microbacterium sp. OR21]|uniref:hypothetical protein n=1 Tax=Microbacterium sp. OR21 TaxID=3095346 RepID=UPI0039B54ED9